MYAHVQGDSAQQAGTTYGAVTEGPGLPNGVVQQQEPSAPLESSLSSALENPNTGETTLPVDRTGVATVQMIPQPVEPPYGREPHEGANVITRTDPEAMTAPSGFPSPPTPTSEVHVQREFFSAQSGPSGAEVQGVRWIARFTEYVRSTANRGVQGFDRSFLERQ